MATSSFVSAFPDRSGAVTSTFFASCDVTEKTWNSVKLLAEADVVTFWTVIANHSRLGSVFSNLLSAIDAAHSSSSSAQRRGVRKEDERFLCSIVIRLATSSSDCTEERQVQPSDFARRLDSILPLSTLFPIATMLFRKSGATASIVLTSLFLLNPSYLCRLQLHLSSWFDHVNRLATRCQSEMQRGRFQRLSGDVLPLFEQTYRSTKHLWAMLQSAPFIADYIPTTRTLRALRIITDVISPILQHFLMTCETLNSRRDVLSKANAVIVNTAVNASSILMLFHTFNRAGGQRAWVIDRIPKVVYDRLGVFMTQYTQGAPQRLLSTLPHAKGPQTLIHQLSPPLDDADDNQIGKVILSLFAPLTDSKDFSDLLLAARERFGEVVLLELVKQGLTIENLLSAAFVTTDEAKKLGISADTIARAMAGLPNDHLHDASDAAQATALSPLPEAAKSGNPTEDPEAGKDPLVDLVAEVFPHFSRHGIRAALNYYNNDPEQFILDASMANVPPHLLTLLEASSVEEAAANAEVPAQAAANAAIAHGMEVANGAKPAPTSKHLTCKDFVDDTQGGDLHLYLGSDLYELVTGSDCGDEGAYGSDDGNNADASSYQDYASYRKGGETDDWYGAAGFGGGSGGVDEDMREKIRMLTEMMYDDELDDGQADEVHVANAGTDTDEEGEKDGEEYTTTTQAAVTDGTENDSSRGQTGISGLPLPRSEYEKKQFRARVARERAKNIKEKVAQRDEHAPAYAKKQKTAKHQKGGGGGKDALTRAFKKGAF